MPEGGGVAKRKPRIVARSQRFDEAARAPLTEAPTSKAPWADTVVRALTAEAERDGLLDGDKTRHVTFRAPPALVEAAKLNLGIESMTELGMLALMMLAQPDPFVATMRRTRGALGEDHTLEC